MAKELTLVELQKQIEELQVKANEIIKIEKAGVIEEIKEKISMYKLTAEDLGFKAPEPLIVYKNKRTSSQGSGTALIPVYRNKNNEAETWHGSKGRLPLWLQAILKELQKTNKDAANPELKIWLDENGYKIPVSVVAPEVATEAEAKAVEPVKAVKK